MKRFLSNVSIGTIFFLLLTLVPVNLAFGTDVQAEPATKVQNYTNKQVVDRTIGEHKLIINEASSVSQLATTEPAVVLGAPTNLKKTFSNGAEVDLTWTTTPGAVAYNVYRATSIDGQYDKVGVATTNRFVDKTVAPTTNYWYYIKAADGNTEGQASAKLAVATSTGTVQEHTNLTVKGAYWKGDAAIPVGVTLTDYTYFVLETDEWILEQGASQYDIFLGKSAEGYKLTAAGKPDVAVLTSGSYASNSDGKHGIQFMIMPNEYTKMVAGVQYSITPSAVVAGYTLTIPTDVKVTMTIKEPIRGDVNGNGIIDAADYALLKAYLAGTATTTPNAISADTNLDHIVNSADLAWLKKYVAGKLELFPCSIAAKFEAITDVNDALSLIPLANEISPATLGFAQFKVNYAKSRIELAKRFGAVDSDFVGMNKLADAVAKITELNSARMEALAVANSALVAIPQAATIVATNLNDSIIKVVDAENKVNYARKSGIGDKEFIGLLKLEFAKLRIGQVQNTVGSTISYSLYGEDTIIKLGNTGTGNITLTIKDLQDNQVFFNQLVTKTGISQFTVRLMPGIYLVNVGSLKYGTETKLMVIKSVQENMKATAIAKANYAISMIPVAADITAANLATTAGKVSDAETRIAAARQLGAVDSDFVGLAKIAEAKAKIAELEGTKLTAIDDANNAIALLPNAMDIIGATLTDAKAKLATAEAKVATARQLGAIDSDFIGLNKITEVKAKIAQLEAQPGTVVNVTYAEGKATIVLSGVGQGVVTLSIKDTNDNNVFFDEKDAANDTCTFIATIATGTYSLHINTVKYGQEVKTIEIK